MEDGGYHYRCGEVGHGWGETVWRSKPQTLFGCVSYTLVMFIRVGYESTV